MLQSIREAFALPGDDQISDTGLRQLIVGQDYDLEDMLKPRVVSMQTDICCRRTRFHACCKLDRDKYPVTTVPRRFLVVRQHICIVSFASVEAYGSFVLQSLIRLLTLMALR